MEIKIEIITILYWFVGGLISIVGILFIRSLNKIEKDIEKLFTMVNSLKTDHDLLQGAHDAITGEEKHKK
jgi:hypothetical protein